MKEYVLKPLATQNILAGNRCVVKEDFVEKEQVSELNEGTVINLIDLQNKFIAKAFVTHQQKALGWVFSLDESWEFNESLIENYIEDAIEVRRDFFENPSTTAFRLFNGEGDGLGGMTIDWYDGYVQINWYSKALWRYREWIQYVLRELLPEIKGIYQTRRYTLDDTQQPIEHVYGNEAPHPLIIKENDIKYAIHLGEEWMTGLFLDQREVRQYVTAQVTGGSVLNLFSYTGGFSVAAAVGKATETISVDVAKRSLEKTKEQFELNGFDFPSVQHSIQVMDVFDYLNYAKRHHKTFDWIICDPPSFARTQSGIFSVEKDYPRLAQQIFELTAVGGFCILSTNHSRYEKERFMQDIQQVLNQTAGTFYFIQSFDLPADFPTTADSQSQYLKVLVYYREK